MDGSVLLPVSKGEVPWFAEDCFSTSLKVTTCALSGNTEQRHLSVDVL